MMKNTRRIMSPAEAIIANKKEIDELRQTMGSFISPQTKDIVANNARINTDIKVAGRSIAGNAGTDLNRTTDMAVAASTWAFVTWAEVADDLGWHDTGSNTERVTVDGDGWYAFQGVIQLSVASARLILRVTKNQTTSSGAGVVGVSEWDLSTGISNFGFVSGIVPLVDGDWLTLEVWTSTAGNVVAGNFTGFRVARIF